MVKRIGRLVLLAPLVVVGLGTIGCVSVRRVSCSTLSCTPEDCRARGEEALRDGRPDEAKCYFKSAIAAKGSDADARLGYGTALVIMGDASGAREQLQWVVDKADDDDSRTAARNWLSAIDSPLPFVVRYRPDEGCAPLATGAGQFAGDGLRRTLLRLGAFRAVTKDADAPVSVGEEAAACTQAGEIGAKVVLFVAVRCLRMEGDQKVSTLGGFIQTTRFETTLSVDIDVYDVGACERKSSLSVNDSAWDLLSGGGAAALAINKALGKVVLKLAKELLFG
jgi:hypothetical protein